MLDDLRRVGIGQRGRILDPARLAVRFRRADVEARLGHPLALPVWDRRAILVGRGYTIAGRVNRVRDAGPPLLRKVGGRVDVWRGGGGVLMRPGRRLLARGRPAGLDVTVQLGE